MKSNTDSSNQIARSRLASLVERIGIISADEFLNETNSIAALLGKSVSEREPILCEERTIFFDDSPAMQIIIDSNAFIRFINKEFINFLGLGSEDEAIGITIYEFIHEDYRERFYFFLQNIVKYLRNNTFVLFRSKRLAKNHLNVFGRYFDQNTILLVLSDITELQKKYEDSRYTSQLLEIRIEEQLSQLVSEIETRKQSEEAATTNELYIRSITNALPEAIYMQNFDTNSIFFFNDVFFNTISLPVSPDRTISFDEFFQLIHPDDLEMETNFLERISAVPDGKALESVIRVRKNDGTYIWAYNRELVFRRDPNGNILQVLGVSENITSKRISELEMQSMQEIMEQFFAKSTDAFFFMMIDEPILWNDDADKDALLEYIFDHQSITKTNIAFQKLFETNSDHVIGITPRQQFSHDIARGRIFWNELFDKGHTHTIIEERTPTGKPIWVEGDYLCLYDSDGRIIGSFGIQRDVSEKISTEDELKRSEEKFRSLTNHLQVGVYRSSPNGEILFVNQHFLDIFDFDSYDDVVNVSAFDFYTNPNDRAKQIDLYSHGDISKIEVEMITRKGRTITVVDTSIAIRNDFGEPEYFDGFIEDITSLRKIEDSIVEINSQYLNLVESIPDVIIRINKDYEITFVNSAVLKYFDHSPEELINQKITSVDFCDEFSEIAEKVIPEVFISLQPVQLSFSASTRCGKYAFELRFVPEFTHDHEFRSVLAIIRDATTQKKVELILRYESNLLRSLSDAVISTDLNLIIRSWNKSAERIYGWTEEEVLGKCLQDLLQTQFVDDTAENAEQTVATKRFWKGELLQFDRFGNTVNIVGTSNLLDGQNGEPEGLVLVNHDITDLKKVEQELRDLNSDLELRVRERTDDLNKALDEISRRNYQLQELNKSIAEDSLKLLQLNTRLTDSESNLLELTRELDYRVQERTRELLEAKTKAEEAVKLKAIILDNLGHELRTPLNGILGFTQVLKEVNENEELTEMIEMISLSSNRLKNTLNSLLALTELEARRINVTMQPLSFKEFIERFVFSFEHVGAKKEVPVEVLILDEKACATVDEYMLEQICFNLLDNAFKFTDEGKITIEVGTDSNGNESRTFIRFIDTGIGIAKEKQSYVFEAFAQESEGIARNYEGVGVGLTITKKMIEMMNGSISLDSEIGKGSSFSVFFPSNAPDDFPTSYE